MVILALTNLDLRLLAEQMGVTLTHHDGGPKGWYDHETRTISTRRRLPIAQYRSTLAHELAHAHYGDEPTDDPVRHLKQERRADKWAADLLLDESAVEQALIWHNHHRDPAAYDLEVTRHLLDVWLTNHERTTAA